MNAKHTLTTGLWILTIFALVTGCSPSASLDDLEEWDLVFISDNSEMGVPYYLPKYIEEDTGKTVNLHNYAIMELSAQTVLNALHGDPVDEQFQGQLDGLREAVTEAEFIVYFAGNYGDIEGMGDLTGDIGACWETYSSCTLPDNCTLGAYQPYTTVVGEIFKEMIALRDGKPTIIRALDFYNPYLDRQEKCGEEMKTECIQCSKTFSDSIRIAADANHVPLVSIYDLFNGVDHDEDPREKGYIGGFGFFPSTEGFIAIADRIREEGYEPITP